MILIFTRFGGQKVAVVAEKVVSVESEAPRSEGLNSSVLHFDNGQYMRVEGSFQETIDKLSKLFHPVLEMK